MRLKQLESALSCVEAPEFSSPNVTLEQYATSPFLTAQVISMALHKYGDLGPDRTVLDLGCGTAMLSIGCALVESDHVFGVDCDTAALEQARMNIRSMELEHCISLVQAKVDLPSLSHAPMQKNHGSRNSGRGRSKPSRPLKGNECKVGSMAVDTDAVNSDRVAQQRFPFADKSVDTVITNPPFGTKADMAGIDVQFLLLACRLARRAVYSFHKTTTRPFIVRTVKGAFPNATVSVIAEMKFDLRQTYKFHQKASVDVAVDLIRVELVPPADGDGSVCQDDD